MKKFVSVISAVILCGALFTGCGEKIAGEFDNLDALAASDVYTLAEENVSAKDSKTYNLVSSFEGASEIYLDVESTDGSMSMVMGIADKKVATKVNDPESETNVAIIIKDSKMYMLDEETKTGYSMASDDSVLAEYDLESMLSELNISEEINNAEDVKTCLVKVDGEKYTFEIAETDGGFLFDKDDKLCAIISKAEGEMTVLKVNAFTTDAPDEIFEIPEGYEISDLESMLAGE